MHYGYLGYLLFMLPALLLGLYAQIMVKVNYSRYSKVISRSGLTGREAAERVLQMNGVGGVRIGRVGGTLTDHYDPRTNTVALSAPVYDSISVGAIGVAAHEVGHAIQYAKNYTPIKIRMAILPVAQFGSSAWILFFILGIVFNISLLRGVGIGLFAAIVLFQLITLPVEFNASRRALATIKDQGILFAEEYKGAKKTLTAAAMTYVASLAVALLQLLRLIASSRRD